MMTLKQIWEPSLAHWSYLIGAENGEAAVIDPNRDIDRYLSKAAAAGLRIVAVLETHIHADYASGAYELAKRTGARLYVSDEGPVDWKYSFSQADNVRSVQDGEKINLSNLEFEVVATPGHTPSICRLFLRIRRHRTSRLPYSQATFSSWAMSAGRIC